MLLIIKIFILLSVFGFLFSFIPKFTYNQVKKLLTYHKYPEQPIKRRFIKVIRVYTILGLTLGFVFLFLLSPIQQDVQELENDKVFPRNSMELIGLSFFVSFLFVIILRIATLLNKSKLYSLFLSGDDKKKVLDKSLQFDYKELKEEIISFLFSIFLTALLGLMIFFVYNLLFNPDKIINLNINQNYNSISTYLLVIIIFTISLLLITFLGELILYWIGVHPKCEQDLTSQS